MTLKNDAEFEEKLICCFQNDENLVNFVWALNVLKFSTLIGFFCANCVWFDLKKYRGVSFMTTKSDAKFEEKLTCGLQNDMRNIANFY